MGEAKVRQLVEAKAQERMQELLREQDERVGGKLRVALVMVQSALDEEQVETLSVVVMVGGRLYALSLGDGPAVHRALGGARDQVQRQALSRLRFALPPECADGMRDAAEAAQREGEEEAGGTPPQPPEPASEGQA